MDAFFRRVCVCVLLTSSECVRYVAGEWLPARLLQAAVGYFGERRKGVFLCAVGSDAELQEETHDDVFLTSTFFSPKTRWTWSVWESNFFKAVLIQVFFLLLFFFYHSILMC